MRSSVIQKSNTKLETYNSLSDVFKNKFLYEEFILVYELDVEFKSKVNGYINKTKGSAEVQEYLLENENLALTLLVNSYLLKYRNFSITDSVSLVYYKRLFGTNKKNGGNYYNNYVDLLNRIVNGKNDFNKNLNNVLSVVRKRERDRVKYFKNEDLSDFSNKVINKLEVLGGSLKAPKGCEKVAFLSDFIIYDEELKGFQDGFKESEDSVDLVIKSLFKLLPYVYLPKEKDSKLISESEVNEKKSKLNGKDISTLENKEEKKVAKLAEKENKRIEKENLMKEKYKDKYLLESNEDVLNYVTKLRNFNKLLLKKNVYNLTDNELYKNLGIVLNKASSSIMKKPGFGIVIYEDKKIFEYLVEFKIEDEVHLFYVTPYFIVNTKTRRVFTDKTKMIKSLARTKVTDLEKSFGAVIMILMKLISGRREKDRMNKLMKNSDVQRINRFAYILKISQEEKLGHYKKKNDSNAYAEANRFKVELSKDENSNVIYHLSYDGVHTSSVKIEYDKNEKPYARILSNNGGNFIITPDFIADANLKQYTYKRVNASAPVALLQNHLKADRSKYSQLNKTDYAYIMNCILKAWDLRRRLVGYSRGFDYVKVMPSKID